MAKVKLQVRGDALKSYVFRVVVEPDEDRWFAYCPALQEYAATTWGYTRDEALQHIREVVEMIVAELLEEHAHIPDEPRNDVSVSKEPRVAVTI